MDPDGGIHQTSLLNDLSFRKARKYRAERRGCRMSLDSPETEVLNGGNKQTTGAA